MNKHIYSYDLDWKTVCPGDTVGIQQRTWTRPIRIHGVSGTAEHPILIEGEPNTAVDVGQSDWLAMELVDCRFVTVRGLVLRGACDTGLVVRHCSFCRIEGLKIEQCRRLLAVRGYSLDLPPNPLDPWQWYQQLPVAAGNVFLNNQLEAIPPMIGADLEYAFANDFVNNHLRHVELKRSCGNRFFQDQECQLAESDFATNNLIAPVADYAGMAQQARAAARQSLAREQAGQDRFWRTAREQAKKLTAFTFRCSDERLERLMDQTLYLLAARVDRQGRCPISPPPALYADLQFQDDPNVAHHFDRLVHGRDSAIAAEALIQFGALELGERIIRYLTAGGVPRTGWGVGDTRRDEGDTQAQLDVPAHLLRALHRHWVLTGRLDLVRPLIGEFQQVFESFELQFSAELNLYVVSCSEQLAVALPFVGLFENCFLLDGFRKLSALAVACNQDGVGTWAEARARRLRQGIENVLKPHAYCLGAVVRQGKTEVLKPEAIGPVFVALRSFTDCDPHAMELAYEAIQEQVVPWGPFRAPITRFQDQRGLLLTMGKDLAWIMAYEARSGRLAALQDSLDFLLEMTTKPAYVVPDHWEYFRHRDLETAWRGYTQNPAGQYTMGVANCEQAAEWLMAFHQEMLGIKVGPELIELRPSLPFSIARVEVKHVPTPLGSLDFEVRRGDKQVAVSIGGDIHPVAIQVTLPVPRGMESLSVTSNHQPISHQCSPGCEVDWIQWRVHSVPCQAMIRWL